MKIGRIIFGLLISGLCLLLVFHNTLIDTTSVNIVEKIEGLSFIWISVALVCLILSYPLNTLRFKYILTLDAGYSFNFFQILPIVWVSAFFSLILPSAAFSDGIRAAMLRVLKISSLSFAIKAVLVDRSMGLIYTLGLAGVFLLISPVNINPVLSNYWGFVFLFTFLGSSLLVYLGSKLANKIQLLCRFRKFLDLIRLCLGSPKEIFVFFNFSIANITISTLSLWCISQGFSLDVSFWVFFTITPTILIVNNLPFFYQGFGGREATMLFAFTNSTLGISPDFILTISLVSGVLLIAAALIGSIFVPVVFSKKVTANDFTL